MGTLLGFLAAAPRCPSGPNLGSILVVILVVVMLRSILLDLLVRYRRHRLQALFRLKLFGSSLCDQRAAQTIANINANYNSRSPLFITVAVGWYQYLLPVVT